MTRAETDVEAADENGGAVVRSRPVLVRESMTMVWSGVVNA